MSNEQHIPDAGPMSLARWSATSGYQFCSCGNWHFVKLPLSTERTCADGCNGCDDCTDYAEIDAADKRFPLE